MSKNKLIEARNHLFEMLPVADFNASHLVGVIKAHIEELDKIITETEQPQPDETLEEAAEHLFGKHFNGLHYEDITPERIKKYAVEFAKALLVKEEWI